MYFGYSEIWRFTFVPAGFVIVMAAFVAFCLVYVVGASSGKRAAARYVSVVSIAFVAASALDVATAAVSGQWGGFVRAFGWSPLFETMMLAVMCVGSMWFMAVSYVNSKHEE